MNSVAFALLVLGMVGCHDNSFEDVSIPGGISIKQPLDAPRLGSPKNGGYVSPSNSVTLRWTTVVNARLYEIEIATNEVFSLVKLNISTDSTLVRIAPLEEARYYWHVRALDNAGLPGLWSQTRNFLVGNSF